MIFDSCNVTWFFYKNVYDNKVNLSYFSPVNITNKIKVILMFKSCKKQLAKETDGHFYYIILLLLTKHELSIRGQKAGRRLSTASFTAMFWLSWSFGGLYRVKTQTV